MRGYRLTIRVAASDRVDLPVQRHDSGRPARGRERREGAPGVRRRVVFEHAVHGADVDVGDESSDHVDLAVERRGPGMRGDGRHQRHLSPRASGRVVFLSERVRLDAA